MYFVIGLGNPGKEYEKTRHNAGFMVIDEICQQLGGLSFQKNTQFLAEIAKSDDVWFVKPQTYMNDSGQAVQAILHYYDKAAAGPDFKNLIVIHDDLDIEIGKYKIQFGTGPKVHNGLGSIYQHVHSENFWHVRVGIDGRQGSRVIPSKDYVLTAFTTEEKPIIFAEIKKVSQEVIQLCQKKLQ